MNAENSTAGISPEMTARRATGLSANFRFLLLNAGISRGGTSAYGVIILWVVLALTHSTVITGLADGMVSVPLFISFLVGALVDRSSRKKTLGLIASIARPAVIGLMFVALVEHSIYLLAALFFSTSILIGFTSDVMNSIRSVWSKQFLDEATYKKGTSLLQASTAIAETAGYGIAGAVLVAGFDSAFLMLAVIFAAAFLAIIPIKTEAEVSQEQGSIRASLSEGLQFVWKTKFIPQIMLVSLLANFLLGTVGIGLTALIQNVFKLPASYFGTLLLVFSIAVIFGSVFAVRVSGSVGKLVTLTMLLIGVFIGLVGISPAIYYDFVLMLGIGLLIGIVNVVGSTILIKRVPQEMMARVQGTITTFGLGMTFISGTVGGIIIAFTSVRIMLEIIGIATVALAAVSVTFRELYRSTV